MDLNVSAFRIVQNLTNEEKKDSTQSMAGRAGGRAGRPARALKLTPNKREELAIKDNKVR